MCMPPVKAVRSGLLQSRLRLSSRGRFLAAPAQGAGRAPVGLNGRNLTDTLETAPASLWSRKPRGIDDPAGR